MSAESNLHIPRFCFEGTTVYDNEKKQELIDVNGFNCSQLSLIADALEYAAGELRRVEGKS